MKFLSSWVLDKYGVITAFNFLESYYQPWKECLILPSVDNTDRQIKGSGNLSIKVIVKKMYITL